MTSHRAGRQSAVLLVVVVLSLSVCASLCLAQTKIAEVYRSPHGTPRGTVVDPTDGSVWALLGNTVVHLDADGHVIQDLGQWAAGRFAPDTGDGSCWIVDCCARQLIHVGRDGREVWRGNYWASGMGIDPRDRSLWFDAWNSDMSHADIVHLSSEGQELLRITDVTYPGSIVVYPNDGSIWLGHWDTTTFDVRHYTADGVLLWRLDRANGYLLSLNPTDGSVWTYMYVTDDYSQVIHLSADNRVLWISDVFVDPADLVVNPVDGTCWYRRFSYSSGGNCAEDLVLLSPEGTEVRRIPHGIGWHPGTLALNPNDGSLWAATGFGLAHMASDGTVLWQDRGEPNLRAVAVDPTDGSYWLSGQRDCYGDGSTAGDWVAHYDALGNELWRRNDFVTPPGTPAIDPGDGSLWITEGDTVHHFARDGTALPTGSVTTGFIAVNPADRSVWVTGANQLKHFSAAGSLLNSLSFDWALLGAVPAPDGSVWSGAWRQKPYSSDDEYRLVHIAANGTLSILDAIVGAFSVSVNPRDGSVWVAYTGTDSLDGPASRVAHVGADGRVLWQGADGDQTKYVAVDPRNGNCWLVGYKVYLLSPTGEEIADTGTSLGGFVPWAVAVNAADGSLWVHEEVCGLRVLAYTGPFPDVAADSPAAAAIRECQAAGIVTGFDDGSYRPTEAVTRGQMAVYVARALCGGEEQVPSGPSVASFPDVAPGLWAYPHIEYCKAHGVVTGFTDGSYQPAWNVTRGQMAAFLARAMAGGEAAVPAPTRGPTFPDVTVDHAFYRHVQYAWQEYVTTGFADGLYHPEGNCTRAQTALFVSRSFHLFQ